VRRVLLLLPTASYRNEDFLAAAAELGVEIVAAADYCHQLAPLWGMNPVLALPLSEPEKAVDKALAHLDRDLDAVLAVDDQGLEVAALLAGHLGLPGNPPPAVRTLRDKLAFRELQRRVRLAHPLFHALPDNADAASLPGELTFPVVVKARRLSASRGVIRADDTRSLLAAVHRVRAIQRRADRDAASLGLVIEAFVPGPEVALEGLLTEGSLQVLALFDKPDPLDGPYFEETIYVTPSRLPESVQCAIRMEVERACRAAGATTGPVHAELRVSPQGIVLLEVAPRSIGGLCGRVLRHALGMSLETVILRHTLGMTVPTAAHREASGVMMVPVPERGIFEGIDGLEAARAVAGVTELAISVTPGQLLAPAPEGSAYPGFIFARGAGPEAVEQALRKSQARLGLRMRPEIPVAAGA
jgi:biotin carboxylase